MTAEYIPVAVNTRIETEDVLGPLPDNWEKAQFGETKRFFFVDHNTKTTTWIDPRTYYIRKHDVREVVNAELPYGWEEAFDPVCGVYYIDHINQKHYLEGPWDESTRFLIFGPSTEPVEEVMAPVSEDSAATNQLAMEVEQRKLDEQLELERIKRDELATAETRLAELEAEKLRIEQAINELRAREQDPENAEAIAQEEAELVAALDNINQTLEGERAVYLQSSEEYNRLKAEIEEFQRRLNELREVNERLERENRELMEHNKETNQNIDEMRNMIEMEAAQRNALEAYIKQLKNEVLEIYSPEQAQAIREKEEKEAAEADVIEVDAPLPVAGTMSENEEAAHLQNRLEEERKERERLKQITETLEAERNKAAQNDLAGLPDWVVDLNVKAQQSSTLRMKVSKADPDQLGFRDKVLKFSAAAIESGEGAKAPALPSNPENENAIRARETAFGQVDETQEEEGFAQQGSVMQESAVEDN